MRKVLKLFFIFFALILATSCVQNVESDVVLSDSVSFNFRAVKELDGAELSVVLFANDEEVNSKKVTINTATSDVVTFDFGQFSLGTIMRVEVSLKKDGVELYHGSESKTVESGSNKIRLNLKPMAVSLTLSANENIPVAELAGSFFKVSVNNKEYTPVEIKSGDKTVSLDIGYVKIGTELNIKASIVKKVGNKEEVLYTVIKNTKADESVKNIVLDFVAKSVKVSVTSKLPAGDLTGTLFKVTANGINYDPVEIKAEDKTVSLDIGYVENGADVKVQSSIVRKEGEKEVILYSGEKTVKASPETKDISIDLVVKSVKVSVKSILPEAVAADSPIVGSTLEVKIGEVTKTTTVKSGDKELVIDFGYFNVGEELPEIRSMVVGTDASKHIYYEGYALGYKVPEKDSFEIPAILSQRVTIETVINNPKDFINGATVNIYSDAFEQPIGVDTVDTSKKNETGKLISSKDVLVMPGNKIRVEVVKDNVVVLKSNEKVITSKDITSTHDLVPVQVAMKLSVDLPRPNTEIDGGKFKVFVDGIEKTTAAVDIQASQNSLTVPMNVDVYSNISGVIEKTGSPDTLRYFESEEHIVTPADKDKEIKLKLKPYGMFMWSYTIDEDGYGIPTHRNSVYFDVVRTPIQSGFYFETTNHKDIPGGYMVDNCIDSNGVAWILVTTSGSLGLEVKLERSSGTAVTIEPNTFEQNCYAMTNFKDGLIVAGDGNYPTGPEATEVGDFVFVNVTDDKTAPSGNKQTKINVLGLPHVMKVVKGNSMNPEAVENNRIAAMCSDENDIYAVIEGEVQNSSGDVLSLSNSVYKITLTADGLTGTATPVVDFEKPQIGMDSYYITDAEFTDGNLYITYMDMSCSASSIDSMGKPNYNHGTGDVSRGGLLKINIGTKSISKLPIVSGEYCDNTNCGQFLVGPRKILAIKPKKLIIADDGAVIDDAGAGAKTKKRIISVDLENFIIESGSAVDLDGVFEGSTAESACDSSAGSFYYYKTNIHAVRG